MTPKEQKDYNQFNQISNIVIGQTAWGQFYGLMRGAASIGEGAIPHKVCFGKNGTEIKVYNSNTGKLAGAFLKPTHEYVQEYLAKKSYGEAFLASLGVYGQAKAIQEMKNATCITVTPDVIIEQQAKKDEQLKLLQSNSSSILTQKLLDKKQQLSDKEKSLNNAKSSKNLSDVNKFKSEIKDLESEISNIELALKSNSTKRMIGIKFYQKPSFYFIAGSLLLAGGLTFLAVKKWRN